MNEIFFSCSEGDWLWYLTGLDPLMVGIVHYEGQYNHLQARQLRAVLKTQPFQDSIHIHKEVMKLEVENV